MPSLPNIAVIEFPGLNCEVETVRSLKQANLKGTLFRWNDSPNKLKDFDGYVIPGGFSYEDRGRAGLIASLDPVLDQIKKEAKKGKPLLGICNGAQILIESGLIPGTEKLTLEMCLAWNKRMKDGQLHGTGFYNTWSHFKSVIPQGRSVFNLSYPENTVFHCPIAHGEGRFVTENPDLLDQLIQNQQIPFRYCTPDGEIKDEFPVNPNGALYNITALCNPEGNILAIMPHPERGFTAPGLPIFESLAQFFQPKTTSSSRACHPDPALRDEGSHSRAACHSCENPCHSCENPCHSCESRNLSSPVSENYLAPENTLEFLVDLIITDNEADTFENTLNRLGFKEITQIKRQTHFTVTVDPFPTDPTKIESLLQKLIQDGILLNTNKETPIVKFHDQAVQYNPDGTFSPCHPEPVEGCLPKTSAETALQTSVLVRDREDFIGLSKQNTLQNRLKMKEIKSVHRGVVWTISLNSKTQKQAEKTFHQILATNIFSNPHSQLVWWY